MTRVLGLDIGGSRTRARLVDDGEVAGEALGPSASPVAAGLARAESVLHELLDELDLSSGVPVAAVCAGAAGGGTAAGREALRRILTRLTGSRRVEVVEDAALVLPAAGRETGVAVVCGTGSIVIVADASGPRRAGGWGYLLGDEGGGYWLVREAIRELLRRRDAGRPPGELGAALLKPGEDLDALTAALYADPRPGPWATRAPTVLASGDAAVADLVDEGARQLADTVLRTVRATGSPDDDRPVVLAGGLTASEHIVAALRRALQERLPRSPVEVLDAPPVAGAVAVAVAATREAGR